MSSLLALQSFGITVDQELNRQVSSGAAHEIQTESSRTRIFVIPTDEELAIAEQTLAVVRDTS